MTMDIVEKDYQLIVTDDVSGRVITLPRVLIVGLPEVYGIRRFIEQAMFNPESFAGVTIVSEGPYGMTPHEMRSMVPPHLWHKEIEEHPTGGAARLHPTREKRRLELIHRARAGKLTMPEMHPPGSEAEADAIAEQEELARAEVRHAKFMKTLERKEKKAAKKTPAKRAPRKPKG